MWEVNASGVNTCKKGKDSSALMGRGWWEIIDFSSSCSGEGKRLGNPPGLLKGRKAIGLRAEDIQSVAGSGAESLLCCGRARRVRRSRISDGLEGGEAARLERCAWWMRSFSALARDKSRSSCAISARRESRSFFFSASSSIGLRPRSSAVVGSGAAGGDG